MAFQLTVHDFEAGGVIPVTFTCDGANVSPALSWMEAPADTESLALIMDDPDAPGQTWVHWVIYDLPASPQKLRQDVRPEKTLASGARQGTNDFKRIGYGGPCPPPGAPHRYYFRLYALDSALDLPAGATRAALDAAMRRHVLARAEYFGRYQRVKTARR